jgi:hypothetical protein
VSARSFEELNLAIEPLERASFDAGSLIRDFPPRWNDRNKRVVFDISRSSGFPFEGQVTYARWPAVELPEVLQDRPRFSVCRGVFKYAVPADPAAVAWHLNFADPHLFVAYGSSLLAQDELQVAEHPVLGSLREMLVSTGKEPCTVDRRGRRTPVTITGVQRRCSIDTRPDPAGGCPDGLYGNAFARASVEQIATATRPLSPPTVSNILALAAPEGGSGEYRRDEMDLIVRAAYSGFWAARQESERLVPMHSRTTIHTGFWGCGAFGGDRTLMTILQSVAADLAGVDTVFWAVDNPGAALAENARQQYERIRNDTPAVSSLLDLLAEQGFRWGVSDGN